MTQVYLENLQLEAIIGVHPHERDNKQSILLNIYIDYDITRAAQTDNLKYTINYQLLEQQISEYINITKFYLLETLAMKLADFILANSAASGVTVDLKKLQPQHMHAQPGIKIQKKRT
jgi:dihydroneopterin aldolase